MTAITGVVTRQNKPLGDAIIMIAGGTSPTPDIAQLSDENGSFRLQLPPGKYRLLVRWEEQSVEKTFSVPLKEGDTLRVEFP